MTEAENIVSEHLRHIRGVVEATRADIREIKGRLGILESQYAHDARVERIEQRLELAEI